MVLDATWRSSISFFAHRHRDLDAKSAVARAPKYLPEASLSPAGAPAVLHLPELDPVLLAIADDDDRVVAPVATFGRIETILAFTILEDTRPKINFR